MPEDRKSTADDAAEPAPPEATPETEQNSEEAGDFINRQVLEKDSTFFEG
ncbi:MAG TPA: hypothetical protein VE959_06995 [Bryobacteraceae bacterium]|nr:hypothetical protein [Bryobacteraceae bacterium]